MSIIAAPDEIPLMDQALAAPSECDQLRAELDAVTKDRAICIANFKAESQLACDLRASQDEIIERCAKAVEEWPEAAKRLREHCGSADNAAVSGEDFGEMRRQLATTVMRYSEQAREMGQLEAQLAAKDALLDYICRADDTNSVCEWLREKLGVADGKIAALVAVVEESHAERDQLREKLAVAKAALEKYVEHFGDPLKVARPALENIR